MTEESRKTMDEVIEKTPDEVEKELNAALSEEGGIKKKRKKWSKKRKIITAAAVAVVALFIASGFFGGKEPMGIPVVTAPLTKGDVVSYLSLSGPISGTDSVDVVSNLHVEILEIPVKEGDKVEKGQLLATLDGSDIQKQLDMAQNTYDLAVSTYNESLRDKQNAYEKALQVYNTAKLNHDRQQVLFAAGDISQADMETAVNTLNDARRELNSYTVVKGRVVPDKSAELKIKDALFELEKKQKDMENTQVKSPIAGTVVRVNCKVGRFADKTDDANSPIFIVENLDNLELEIKVSEYSIGRVKLGQEVSITADILGEDTVKGEVTAISPTGEEKGGGSSERVIPITVVIKDKDTKLIAGITAKAEIITGEAKDVYKVPISAVTQDAAGNPAIAIVTDQSTAALIPVETGIESDLEIEIRPFGDAVFTDGMNVITNPMPGLMDGAQVLTAPGM